MREKTMEAFDPPFKDGLRRFAALGRRAGVEDVDGLRKKGGPTKWCHQCSRMHAGGKTKCDLYLRDRLTRGKQHKSKSGLVVVTRQKRIVKRWAH